MIDIFAKLKVGCHMHFLDSGSFTLWRLAAEYAKKKGCGLYQFYDTKKFWRYVKAYCGFIKKYSNAIDLYANVDVIPEPTLTFRNQRYIEQKYHLHPVPVVHYTTDLDWLKKYISLGYKVIALGGLVGSTTQEACKAWIDKAFEIVCDTPNGMPKVAIHGFGVTSYPLLLRYPWWSVDSSSWTKVGAYGGVLVPHLRGGKFVFTETPYVMKFSNDASDRTIAGKHFDTLNQEEKKVLLKWLEEINVPLGKDDSDGDVIEYGVRNRHSERKAANLYFFERMRNSIPEWPWPFKSKKRKGFGIL